MLEKSQTVLCHNAGQIVSNVLIIFCKLGHCERTNGCIYIYIGAIHNLQLFASAQALGTFVDYGLLGGELGLQARLRVFFRWSRLLARREPHCASEIVGLRQEKANDFVAGQSLIWHEAGFRSCFCVAQTGLHRARNAQAGLGAS